jgi:hypothetical protein
MLYCVLRDLASCSAREKGVEGLEVACCMFSCNVYHSSLLDYIGQAALDLWFSNLELIFFDFGRSDAQILLQFLCDLVDVSVGRRV